MFQCVPGIFFSKRNVSMCSWIFYIKTERFNLFQKFFFQNGTFLFNLKLFLLFWNVFVWSRVFRKRNGTFLFVSGILKDKTERFVCSKNVLKQHKSFAFGPNFFRSERKRFGSITNFVKKTYVNDFFRDGSRKTLAYDLEKTLV